MENREPTRDARIAITAEAFTVLQHLRRCDKRTIGGQVEWLIEQEQHRRSLRQMPDATPDPDELMVSEAGADGTTAGRS